jgi:glyceraldehyde-3-phosphate dehydrogenase (NADP+)
MMFDDPALAALFPSSLDAIPEKHRIDPEHHPARYQIGKSVITVSRADLRLPVYSKIALNQQGTLKPILVGWTPKVGPTEARAAVAAAVKAWDDPAEAAKWRRAPWETRVRAIEKFSTALAAKTEQIATLLMYEIGKPYPDAKKEVTRSVEYIDNTIVELMKLLDQTGKPYFGQNGKITHHARDVLRPSGIVLCVGPFNYPINELFTTVVPALLMGNPVIIKTPRFGVLANQLLMDELAEIFPPGVVSMLPGDGKEVIPDVIASKSDDVFGKTTPRIRTLAFIGSEAAAHAISNHHPAQSFLTKILGLGAKNPAVVLPGANLSDDDISKLVKGALGNNGQRCTAEKIFFAPEDGDFVDRLAAKVSQLKLGMPWDDGVAITPLPEDKKLEWMREYIDDAIKNGARVVNDKGGTGLHSIMRPAVLDRVRPGMRIHFEEQFGPIVPVRRYSTPFEAIEWERKTPFGQQACIWGPAGGVKEELAELFLDEVARLNLDDICQRGPDSFGFTATEKSGFGTLSLKDALLAFSRATILQSPSPEAIV